MIHRALSKQAERWGINKASGLNNAPELAQHLHVRRSELAQTWVGGIMCYCEFSPGGNGRLTDNPKALARYLKRWTELPLTGTEAAFLLLDLRLLIIAAFYAPITRIPQLRSQICNNMRKVRFILIAILKVIFQNYKASFLIWITGIQLGSVCYKKKNKLYLHFIQKRLYLFIISEKATLNIVFNQYLTNSYDLKFTMSLKRQFAET